MHEPRPSLIRRHRKGIETICIVLAVGIVCGIVAALVVSKVFLA